MNKKVLIIGAGASGYAAGCRLLEEGLKDITILEAQNRVGGRVHSVKFGQSNVDMGAQWVHGEKDNIIYDMVKNLSLIQPSFNNYGDLKFVDSNGKFVDDKTAVILTRIAYSLHDTEAMIRESDSFGEFFIERYDAEAKREGIATETAEQVKEWFHKFFNSINASYSWFEVSARGLVHYKECEGDLTLNWKEKGFTTIFDVLKKKIPNPKEELPIDSKIIFNKQVTKIMWGKTENVVVYCKDGTKYEADYVILTSSLGYLKQNYKSLFFPLLPKTKINAIKHLGIGTVNKIYLSFSERWWPKNTKGFSFIWSEKSFWKDGHSTDFGDLKTANGKSWIESIFGFYTIDNNPNVLMGWIVGPLGPQYEQLPDHIVLNACMYILNKFLGKYYEIGQCTNILRSKWYSNEFTRGSYSFRTLETEEYNTSAEELSEPLKFNDVERVLFAGEATHSRYYSTVHGAIESGFREADRVLKLLRFNNNMQYACHSKL